MSQYGYLGMAAANRGMPDGFSFGRQLGLAGIRAVRDGGDGQRMLPMDFYRMMAMRLANPGTTTRSQVISPGPTQVIRPSAQAPQRRAAAPQAGASSSLITSTPSPAEVALATTTLLGG
jgi:hypothetical protein